MKHWKIRRQRPLPGGRDPLPSTVDHEIKRRIEQLAASHHCSRSFVVKTLLADSLGVTLENDDRFDMVQLKKRA